MPAVRLRASCGGIAQLEEHLLCKQGVSGSNPLTSTRIREQGAGNQGFDESEPLVSGMNPDQWFFDNQATTGNKIKWAIEWLRLGIRKGFQVE